MLHVWRMLLSWDTMCSVELTSSKEKSCWLPYLNPKLTVNKENRERICEVTSHPGWTFNVSTWKIVEFSWLRKRSTYLCALKAQCPGIWPVTLSELKQRPAIQHVLTWPVGPDHWCQVKEWPFYHPHPRLRQRSHRIFAFLYCRTFVKIFPIMLSKSMPSLKQSSPWSCSPTPSTWLWTSTRCNSSGTSSASQCWFCGSAFCKVCRTPMATTPDRRTFCKLSPKRRRRWVFSLKPNSALSCVIIWGCFQFRGVG